jgi:TonB family protein
MKISLEWWRRRRPRVPGIPVLVLLLIFSCTSLLAQEPKDAEAYFRLGVEHATAADKDTDRKARIEAAIDAFKAAIRLKPTWAEAHYELGRSFSSLGKYEQAAAAFQEAIRNKPEFADAHEKLAVAYLYQSDFYEGIEHLKEAIRIRPDSASAHKLMGMAYLALDKREEATKVYDALKPLDQEMANFLLSCIERPEKFVFGVRQGKRISTPQPPYPDEARKNHIGGSVRVHVVIDEQGNVVSSKAVSGPLELRSVCEAAAMKARFTPTLLSGMPVKVTGAIDYNFVAR